MIKREDVIFDPADPRAVALEGKEVLVSDYYDMRDAKKCVYERYEKTELPFFCDGEYFTFIAQIPSPTYRPFRSAHEFKPYRDRWLIIKCGQSRTHTTYYDNQCILVGKERFTRTYADAFGNITFEDGTPFGIQE